MFCKLRVNKDEKKGKLQLWPDSSANDYLSQSRLLENYCAYEMAMDFEKKYNTYKEADEMLAAKKHGKTNEYKTLDMDDNDLRKRHYFLEDHPGHFYAYLKRRKLIVIPKVSMRENMLCDIVALALDKDSASESVVICRENYAKQALLMFHPHRTIDDIMLDNSFW